MSIPLPLPDYAAQGSTRKKRYLTLTAAFGDGYSQTAPAGVNPAVDSWNVTFENLNATERAALWAGLDAVQGTDYFTWQPPGYPAPLKWKLNPPEVSETPVSGEHWTVSFALTQTR